MIPNAPLINKKWELDSRFDAIEPVCKILLAQLGMYGLESNFFELQLLLREAFNNAVEHGNTFDSELKVHCSFRLYSDMVEIEIEDQGKGFDWQGVEKEKTGRDMAEGGRGLIIYKMYAETVEFNDAGNRVLLRKRIQYDQYTDLEKADVLNYGDLSSSKEVFITLNKDLRTCFAEAVKKQLIEILENNSQILILTLDLNNVKIMDSRGFAALLSAYKILISRKGKLRLKQVSKELYAILKMVNLNRHFEIIESSPSEQHST